MNPSTRNPPQNQSLAAVRLLVARRPVVSFVALAYAISWTIWIGLSRIFTDPSIFVVIPGGFGPAIAAAIIVAASGGSLRAWVQDMARWQVDPRWYLAALGLPVLFVGVESLVYAVFVGPLDLSLLPKKFGSWIGIFLFALILTGGNEELGWRGFMQPRLQRSYGAITAAGLVGVVWTIWHLPLHMFLPSLSNGFAATGLLMRAATVPIAVVYAWLYNATDGSVVITMLFHAGFNSSGALIPASIGGLEPTSMLLLRGTRVAVMLVVVILIVIAYDTEALSATGRHTQPAVSEPGGEHPNPPS